jgi:D-arginine dehydrogenase
VSERADVLVVGAGLAGAATAFFLSRERGVRVLLLEQEPAAGRHSSGRSAGLVRRASGDAALDPLCDEGAEFLAAPPADFPGPTGFRRTGSWLLVGPEQAERWARRGVEVAVAADLAREVPPFRADPRAAVLHAPDDGIVDPPALLAGFLEGARVRGVELRLERRVARPLVDAGRVSGVATANGTIDCDVLVDAAGAWAGELASAAGAGDGGLAAGRRHLLVTAPDSRVDPAWPWVWDTGRSFYFRPESGGLLASACDDTPEPPRDSAADPSIAASIAAKLAQALPELAGLAALPPRRLWAGQRTRAASGRFLLGEDERIAGFVWAAGLGGHGVTAAAAAGRRAAEAALAALRRARR